MEMCLDCIMCCALQVKLIQFDFVKNLEMLECENTFTKH